MVLLTVVLTVLLMIPSAVPVVVPRSRPVRRLHIPLVGIWYRTLLGIGPCPVPGPDPVLITVPDGRTGGRPISRGRMMRLASA